jgi:hypothetical protein
MVHRYHYHGYHHHHQDHHLSLRHTLQTIPSGMSSYQADWFMDEQGRVDFNAEEQDEGERWMMNRLIMMKGDTERYAEDNDEVE